jgi:hypothetical protein
MNDDIGQMFGLLGKLKTLDGFKQHHPKLVLSNGDTLGYYYNYYIMPFGAIIFTMEPTMLYMTGAQYSYRIISPSEMESALLDVGLVDPDNFSAVTADVSEDAWQAFVIDFLQNAKNGTYNEGLEFINYDLKASAWFAVNGINSINTADKLVNINTCVSDMGQMITTYKSARLLTPISTITSISMKVTDWYKCALKDYVHTDTEMQKDLVDLYNKTLGGKRIHNWISTKDRISRHMRAYDVNDRVRYNGVYYISMIPDNTTVPGVSGSSWQSYTDTGDLII